MICPICWMLQSPAMQDRPDLVAALLTGDAG
jgi:hypothetical protein